MCTILNDDTKQLLGDDGGMDGIPSLPSGRSGRLFVGLLRVFWKKQKAHVSHAPEQTGNTKFHDTYSQFAWQKSTYFDLFFLAEECHWYTGDSERRLGAAGLASKKMFAFKLTLAGAAMPIADDCYGTQGVRRCRSCDDILCGLLVALVMR